MSSGRVALPHPPLLVITDRGQARAPLTEIAEALSIKTGTVKSRLHYARQSLRHKIERTDR